MKILLLSLPGFYEGDEPLFPLGIGYLVAALSPEHEVKAIHYSRMKHVPDRLTAYLASADPDLVGLTCNSFNRGIVRRTIGLVRQSCPRARIMVGGVHATCLYRQMLENFGADMVVLHEGEETVRELCRTLEQGGDLASVKGLAFKRDGEVILNEPCPVIENLDDLPLPNQSFAGDLMRRSGMGYLITSRGCPVRCQYCSTSHYWGQRVRAHSVKRVVDEMEELVKCYQVRRIFFHDDTFNLSVKRVLALCEEIGSRALDVNWGVSCRVSPVSQEMIDRMVAAGCRHICWGIESGSPAMLQRINKRITRDQIRAAYEMCRKHHASLSVGAFAMVGNPGETEETIRETVDFLDTLPMTDPPSTSVLYVLPGTQIHDLMKAVRPDMDQFWLDHDGIRNYTLEHSQETLDRWARQVAASGKLVPFDRSRHFWNNILFGNIPPATEPALPDPTSELDRLIPPEIVSDEFHDAIREIVERPGVCSILEIGSSAGGGSTRAIVSGMSRRGPEVRLYCMELSRPRFAALQQAYREEPRVVCYNCSSVALDRFLTREEVSRFYRDHETNLNAYPLERVLGWLEQDIAYIRRWGPDEPGIARIKREQGLERFDMVLIDGSAFTGRAELDEVFGSGFILLDDINDIKNYDNYHRLKDDPLYRLERENWGLRNGYAIFRRTHD